MSDILYLLWTLYLIKILQSIGKADWFVKDMKKASGEE